MLFRSGLFGLFLSALLAVSAGAEDAWSPGVVPDEWRLIEEIQRYPLLSETPPDLAAACEHADPIVREATAWALRRKPDAAMLPCVERLLEAPEYAVRFAGLGALTAIESPVMVEPLLAFLTTDRLPNEYPQAAQIGIWLQSIGLPEWVPWLRLGERREWLRQLRLTRWAPERTWSASADRPQVYPRRSMMISGDELKAVLHIPARPRGRTFLLRLAPSLKNSLDLFHWKSIEWAQYEFEGAHRGSTGLRTPRIAQGSPGLSVEPDEALSIDVQLSQYGNAIPPGAYRIRPMEADGFTFVRVARSAGAETKTRRMIQRARSGDLGAIDWLGEQRVRQAVPVLMDIYRRTSSESEWLHTLEALGRVGDPRAIPLLLHDSFRWFGDHWAGSSDVLLADFYPDYFPYAERVIHHWREHIGTRNGAALVTSIAVVGREASEDALGAVAEMTDWLLDQGETDRYERLWNVAAGIQGASDPERTLRIAVKAPYFMSDTLDGVEEARLSAAVEGMLTGALDAASPSDLMKSSLLKIRRNRAPKSYWERPVLVGSQAEYRLLAESLGAHDWPMFERRYEEVFSWAAKSRDPEVLLELAESALRQGESERVLEAADLADEYLLGEPTRRTNPYRVDEPPVLELRAQALADLGLPEEARAEFKRLRRLVDAGHPRGDATRHLDRLEAYAAQLPNVTGLRVSRKPLKRVRSPRLGFHRWRHRTRWRVETRRSVDQAMEGYPIFPSRPQEWLPVAEDRFVAWFEEAQALALYQLGAADPVWRVPFDGGRDVLDCAALNDALLIAEQDDGKRRLIDLETGATVAVTEERVPDCVLLSRPVISSSDYVTREGAGVAAYSLPSGTRLWRVDDVGACRFLDADDETVLCHDESGEVRAYDRADGRALWVRRMVDDVRSPARPRGTRLVVNRSQGRSLAIFGHNRVVVFETRTGEPIARWRWQPARRPEFGETVEFRYASLHLLPFDRGTYVVVRWQRNDGDEASGVDVVLLDLGGRPVFQAAAPQPYDDYRRSSGEPFVRDGRLYIGLSRHYEVWSHPAAVGR